MSARFFADSASRRPPLKTPGGTTRRIYAARIRNEADLAGTTINRQKFLSRQD
jgi:hypothetical protein